LKFTLKSSSVKKRRKKVYCKDPVKGTFLCGPRFHGNLLWSLRAHLCYHTLFDIIMFFCILLLAFRYPILKKTHINRLIGNKNFVFFSLLASITSQLWIFWLHLISSSITKYFSLKSLLLHFESFIVFVPMYDNIYCFYSKLFRIVLPFCVIWQFHVWMNS